LLIYKIESPLLKPNRFGSLCAQAKRKQAFEAEYADMREPAHSFWFYPHD